MLLFLRDSFDFYKSEGGGRKNYHGISSTSLSFHVMLVWCLLSLGLDKSLLELNDDYLALEYST